MNPDETPTTEQPPTEITVNGHQYRVAACDLISGATREWADEIKALMKEYRFSFSEATTVAMLRRADTHEAIAIKTLIGQRP